MDIEPRMVNNIAHSAVLLNKPIMYIPCPPYSSLSNKLYQITVIISTIIEKARWFRIKTIVLICVCTHKMIQVTIVAARRVQGAGVFDTTPFGHPLALWIFGPVQLFLQILVLESVIS